ncbi:TonB-dependent siderophore receptor [Sphingomonas floccifaciens]|uniref:TonB-dependent siderophore receptor n=1 Tax=Sphingomonas floccifaciens TaxID=1844115 RepID=A0ABW4N9L6_9SPHN
MSRTFTLGLATSLGALAWASVAAAQTAPATTGTTQTDDASNQRGVNPTPDAADPLNEIIVTGTRTRGATVLTSSSAITVADRLDLDRKAPRSTAQALELIPGIFVEGSGGEASNNFSVRGLAGGGQQFVQLQEDGLPVFYINALSDTVLKQGVYIDRLEAVRSGSSGILTVNGAGATINFINKKPNYDRAAGSVQLGTSSYGTARFETFMTQPIAENTAISIGGFYRYSEGLRNTGYPADHGFQWRGAIAQRFASGGELILSAKVIDDHSTFYLPVPVTGVGRPRSIPGISALDGTMAGRDVSFFRNFTSPRTGSSTKDVDLRDGVATKAYTLGYDLTKDLSDQFSFFAKGRYTSFGTNFNAFFSYDNDALQLGSQRLNPAATDTSDRANGTRAALARFRASGATRLAYRYVDTGQIIDGTAAQNALNGNGLVSENVAANNRASVKEFNSDTGVRWQADKNSLTVGALFTKSSRYNDSIGTATVLTDVRDNARRLDVVALNAAGQIVGYQTDRGVLNYGTWGEGSNNLKFESISAYAQDELKLFDDRLRIDGGIRYEHFNVDRRFGNTVRTPIAGSGTYDANGNLLVDADNIIANNYISGGFDGTFGTQTKTWDKVAYTLGANFLVTDRFAVYGRYATGFQGQEQNDPTELEFAEAGVRYGAPWLQATLAGFYTRFKNYPFSRASLVVTGRNVVTDSDIEVYGGEFDITVRPVDWFRIQATGVLQRSRLSVNRAYLDDGRESAPPARDIQNIDTFNGNRPERTPATNVTVTPSFVLPNGMGEVYGSWKRIGKIYADISNSLVLPGYDLFSAGVLFNVAPNVQLNISVENITNAIGLTEGNPRGGFTENTGSNFYFARPIFGRNAVASVRIDF